MSIKNRINLKGDALVVPYESFLSIICQKTIVSQDTEPSSVVTNS